MSKNWKAQKEPLQQISGNASGSEGQPEKPKALGLKDNSQKQQQPQSETDEQQLPDDGTAEAKASKARRFKVQGETQTSKYPAVR